MSALHPLTMFFFFFFLPAPQTYREPVSDYQVLREKAASQRRDVERALTRFMAKTGETQSLFKDDVSTFPCELSRTLCAVNDSCLTEYTLS